MGTGAQAHLREAVEFHRRFVAGELQVAEQRLAEFERRHGFSSADFERRFESGELGDDREWFDWLAEVEAARALRAKLAALEGLP
ncbi:MAG TPA: hypothetical protein VGB42_02305 [Candidatus Thermoplasmatota archaeon]